MATNMPLLSFTKDNKDCSESNGYISVSYTHLTLPTKAYV